MLGAANRVNARREANTPREELNTFDSDKRVSEVNLKELCATRLGAAQARLCMAETATRFPGSPAKQR